MEEEPKSSFSLPLTFGGVAAFAHGSLTRLWAFQAAVALLAALAITVFFERAWVPVLTRTLAQLPARGFIQNGQLNCTPTTTLRGTGTSFLWITVDPTDSADPGEGADLQVELGRNEVRLRSLFGFFVLPYPQGYIVAVNRSELEPWWGAWHPAIVLALAAGVVLGLFVTWTVLAWIYAWPVRFISFYADRRLSLLGAWRLASAALLPGALLLILAIVAYTFHRLNLVQLLAGVALHLMTGWVFILAAPFCLPRDSSVAGLPKRANPFGTAKPKSKTKRRNPFSGR